jgi:hypothetical protein
MLRDSEQFPEMNSFDVGDPVLAKEIARRWNSYPGLLDACKHAVERNCGCHSSEGPHWHSRHCSVPILRAAIQKAEASDATR